jgi:hypothetical protein
MATQLLIKKSAEEKVNAGLTWRQAYRATYSELGLLDRYEGHKDAMLSMSFVSTLPRV